MWAAILLPSVYVGSAVKGGFVYTSSRGYQVARGAALVAYIIMSLSFHATSYKPPCAPVAVALMHLFSGPNMPVLHDDLNISSSRLLLPPLWDIVQDYLGLGPWYRFQKSILEKGPNDQRGFEYFRIQLVQR